MEWLETKKQHKESLQQKYNAKMNLKFKEWSFSRYINEVSNVCSRINKNKLQ